MGWIMIPNQLVVRVLVFENGGKYKSEERKKKRRIRKKTTKKEDEDDEEKEERGGGGGERGGGGGVFKYEIELLSVPTSKPENPARFSFSYNDLNSSSGTVLRLLRTLRKRGL